jgi:hypothetical protein
LKRKGKYEEWVSLGSKFGLTSDTSKAKFFLSRPVKYYDVDGNIVNVSMVSDKYRTDAEIDNIAVFKQYFEEDPTHVNQSTYRIINSDDTLSTSGLATCTGLAMVIGTKKFMTHLDAGTDAAKIISVIKKTIADEKVDPNSLIPYIYPGNLNSRATSLKAEYICTTVGIPEQNYEINDVCMFDKVVI